MVLVLDKKFLEGTWWKWAAGVFALQTTFWVLLGYRNVKSFDVLGAFASSWVVWGCWLLFAFLSFGLGRLQLTRAFWLGIVGYGVASAAYFTLSMQPPVRALLSGLLPFYAFIQLQTMFLMLGGIVEFGAYVYRKVFKE